MILAVVLYILVGGFVIGLFWEWLEEEPDPICFLLALALWPIGLAYEFGRFVVSKARLASKEGG